MSSDRARPDACFVLRFEVSDPHVIHSSDLIFRAYLETKEIHVPYLSLPGCLAGACAYQTDGMGATEPCVPFSCSRANNLLFFTARIGSACLEDCDGESKQQCTARQTHPGIQTRVARSG
jgi:hypothetical protein